MLCAHWLLTVVNCVFNGVKNLLTLAAARLCLAAQRLYKYHT
jgi:hypothetical protein